MHALLSKRDAITRARESLTSVINRNTDRLRRIVVLIELGKFLENENFRPSQSAVETTDFESEPLRAEHYITDSIDIQENSLEIGYDIDCMSDSYPRTAVQAASHAAAAPRSSVDGNDLIPDPPAHVGATPWHPAAALISAGAVVRGLPLWHVLSGEAADRQRAALCAAADDALRRERAGGGGGGAGGGGAGFFVEWEALDSDGEPGRAAPTVMPSARGARRRRRSLPSARRLRRARRCGGRPGRTAARPSSSR